LHEPAGKCLFGPSWDGRRAHILDHVNSSGQVIDVGCGAGHLVESAIRQGIHAVGIDPSARMLARPRRIDLPVVQARAEALPLATGSCTSIMVSYPGPWIRNAEVWAEFARILQPGSSIVILLGGTVERGSGAFIRSLISRMMYGSTQPARQTFEPPLPDEAELRGYLDIANDTWGTVCVWRGYKSGR
jgi:SAM-dependent methyltransferase